MNDQAPQTQDPKSEKNVNAEAIEQARERVRDRERLLEKQRSERQRQEFIDNLFRAENGTPLLFTAFILISTFASGVVWLWSNLPWPSYYFIRTLDALVGARALRFAPWLIWALVGGGFGAVLGHLLAQPKAEERKAQASWLWLPFAITALVAALTWVLVR